VSRASRSCKLSVHDITTKNRSRGRPFHAAPRYPYSVTSSLPASRGKSAEAFEVSEGDHSMVDEILVFAVSHYVLFGLIALSVGIGLNLLITCGPDLIEAIRHPRLN
jgi:hypothetical protein